MLSPEEKSRIQQEWLAEEERLEAKELADLILRLVDEFGQLPEEINEGNCEAFAYEIRDYVPEARVLWWGDDARGDEALVVDGVHCFVEIGDRYYDSERPYGEDDWRQLPCFVRHREYVRRRDAARKVADVVLERSEHG